MIKKILSKASKILENKNITSSSLDAEVLLSHVIQKSKEFLYTHPDYKLTKSQKAKFDKLIYRRKKYEPLAYILGQKEFYGLDFIVNKKVLIPRPETELLIDEVVSFIKSTNKYRSKIIDIGTGSGCIAITIKKQLPKTKITAVDISRQALNVAQKNAKNNKLEINFIKSDLLSNVKKEKFDIVIANLPYLDSNDKKIFKSSLSKPLKHEPQSALFGGKYGLEIYEKLFQQINNIKHKPLIIFCEISHANISQTKKLVKKYFPEQKSELKKDLAGLNRILIISFFKK